MGGMKGNPRAHKAEPTVQRGEPGEAEQAAPALLRGPGSGGGLGSERIWGPSYECL